jgi:hypothetical protein
MKTPHNDMFFAKMMRKTAQNRGLPAAHDDPDSGSGQKRWRKDTLCEVSVVIM